MSNDNDDDSFESISELPGVDNSKAQDEFDVFPDASFAKRPGGGLPGTAPLGATRVNRSGSGFDAVNRSPPLDAVARSPPVSVAPSVNAKIKAAAKAEDSDENNVSICMSDIAPFPKQKEARVAVVMPQHSSGIESQRGQQTAR